VKFTLYLCLALSLLAVAESEEPAIITKMIESPYQPEAVPTEILAPDTLDPARRYPVLYILPVAPGTTSRWGSGIREAAKADVANRYGVICIAPAFAATPWFADHPSDPALQQESHFIKAVIPWVEANYPAARERAGRLLLGFSKSGYGAVMLLLRHPELFERAVAWDAPLGKTAPDQFNMIEVFGTAAHFAPYAIPDLLRQRAEELKEGPPRIFLMPDREGDHPMEKVREQMTELGIPCAIEYTSGCKHSWESGWVPRAAELVITGK
jgi:S-formylglutathione hydrolase FrmB